MNDAWKSAGQDRIDQRDPGQQAKVGAGVGGQLRSSTKNEERAIPSREGALHRQEARSEAEERSQPGLRARTASHANGRKSDQPAIKVELVARRIVIIESLEELEADIDRLMFKVMGLGGLSAIEESLRQARRLLYGGFSANGSRFVCVPSNRTSDAGVPAPAFVVFG